MKYVFRDIPEAINERRVPVSSPVFLDARHQSIKAQDNERQTRLPSQTRKTYPHRRNTIAYTVTLYRSISRSRTPRGALSVYAAVILPSCRAIERLHGAPGARHVAGRREILSGPGCAVGGRACYSLLPPSSSLLRSPCPLAATWCVSLVVRVGGLCSIDVLVCDRVLSGDQISLSVCSG